MNRASGSIRPRKAQKTLVNLELETDAEVKQRVSETPQVNLDDATLVALPCSVQVWALK
jgi:hypothetical protein